MNDADSKKTSDNPPAVSPRGKPPLKKSGDASNSGRALSGLALILAALALIASGYIWYTTLYENADLFSMDITGALERIESSSNQAQETLATTETDIKSLKETQETLKASLEKINTDLTRNRTEWALTEAEQLLVIANNRLQLARDTHSALAALRAADQQLQLLASPKLLPVRRELAREMSLLESLDKLDVSGMTLRLATLADNVDRLPLATDIRLHEFEADKAPAKQDATQKAATESNWRQTARNLWQDMLSLVRIRNDLESQRPLLPPTQQYFLRENLRLMLYGAQQALLQGSIPTYQQNLKSAQRLLKDYFDLSSQVVLSAQDDLIQLQDTKVVADLPDITSSLTTLRRLNGRRAEP
jgi:uncharacterized protein HemX